MNSTLLGRRLAAGAVFFAATLTAYPQLVQLRYTGTVRFTIPGAGWFDDGELVTDGSDLTPVQVDVSFDSQLAPYSEPDPNDSVFFPQSDPNGSGPDQLMWMRFGHVDLTVPIDRIEFDAPNGILRFFSQSVGPSISLSQYTVPRGPRGSSLPTYSVLSGPIGGFFSITIPEGLPVSPGFFEADMRKVTPVPEPATYGFLATIFLGCFAVRRRRRRA